MDADGRQVIVGGEGRERFGVVVRVRMDPFRAN